MDLEGFEKIVKNTRKEFQNKLMLHDASSSAKVLNIAALGKRFLPEHRTFFNYFAEFWMQYSSNTSEEAIKFLNDILDLIEIEKSAQKDILEAKIFSSSEDKLKQAGIAFRNEDYPSVMNNLNTALELLLKDKLGIPLTISKINTVRIIDILVKHKIGPYAYFSEAKKHICLIDNKIKHQGYSPTKIDSINGIKAMEELISKLRNVDVELDEDVRKKIYKEL